MDLREIASVIGGGKKAPDGTGTGRAGIAQSIAATVASR